MEEIENQLQNIKEKLDEIVKKLDLPLKQTRKLELEAEAMRSDLWQNRQKAEEITAEIAAIEAEQKKVKELNQAIEDGLVLLELLKEESSEKLSLPACQAGIKNQELRDELDKKIREVEVKVNELEISLFLNGRYDRDNAVFTIYAGQGGTEACDWAEMLSRMYSRYAAKKGWKIEEIDRVKGEEAGIKSVTYEIKGAFAYGYLKGEKGTHRLVRLSPFNANNLRQTSFAGVEVTPVINEDVKIEIKEDELEFEAYHASSHGGQNVQKVSTAVRLRHKPSGIVVTCQAERSQAQNRVRAMKLLKSKLIMLEEEELIEEKKKLKGEHVKASWGNQIRSYVLHPYKMVKDLRTGYESSQPEKVLDGGLEGFIEAELKSQNSNLKTPA